MSRPMRVRMASPHMPRVLHRMVRSRGTWTLTYLKRHKIMCHRVVLRIMVRNSCKISCKENCPSKKCHQLMRLHQSIVTRGKRRPIWRLDLRRLILILTRHQRKRWRKRFQWLEIDVIRNKLYHLNIMPTNQDHKFSSIFASFITIASLTNLRDIFERELRISFSTKDNFGSIDALV